MRVLSNLPLECFDERDAFAKNGVVLCTFGPADRMLVDDVHHPFDVAFDPSRGTWEELVAALPDGFVPDLVMIWWPDQEPLPEGLERCPVPVVGVVSDYNLTLSHLVGLWPFFDTLLCDRAGVELFSRLSFADVAYWCQYAHKRPSHRLWPDVGARDVDVGFAGNLDPDVQRDRAPWIGRVRALADRGVRAEVTTGVVGADYGRFLNRCRIGWNRSIRGEMNLRGFEVPACGALLLMERDNLEVRDFFAPDEECVLYGDDDFEHVVEELLADPARVRRIASAGHRRVQDHRLSARLPRLRPLAAGPLRRPTSTAADRALGRATAMLTTWADGHATAEAALTAYGLAPDDPRAMNALALATMRWRGAAAFQTAFDLLHRAIEASPDYLPAAVNLRELAVASGNEPLQRAITAERDRRLADLGDWTAIDGPTLPIGFTRRAIDRSLALQSAVREGRPDAFAATLTD